MPRRALDPEQRLETVAVRLEPLYVGALDLIAQAIADRSGRRVKRSSALRAILTPVLGAIVRRQDIARAIRATKIEMLSLGRAAGALVRLSPPRLAARTGPILKALDAAEPRAPELEVPRRRKEPPSRRAGNRRKNSARK
jgi:hypothetical protein